MQINKCYTLAMFTAVRQDSGASDVFVPNRSASACLEHLF
jgi:hypothetical protein